ncbi:hypothetical protein ACFSQ7_37565 [Paenibacillus rhizoplanae]
MELEERQRPPLSPDFHREERNKSRNLGTTAAGSPNVHRSDDEASSSSLFRFSVEYFKQHILRIISKVLPENSKSTFVLRVIINTNLQPDEGGNLRSLVGQG